MKDINVRYLLALYWLGNWESWTPREDYRCFLDNKCPIIQDNRYRFSVILKKWFITKGSYTSLDRATEYYFDKCDMVTVNVFKGRYTQKQLDEIIQQYY